MRYPSINEDKKYKTNIIHSSRPTLKKNSKISLSRIKGNLEQTEMQRGMKSNEKSKYIYISKLILNLQKEII